MLEKNPVFFVVQDVAPLIGSCTSDAFARALCLCARSIDARSTPCC